ncbi:TetR/AcrR family transcriptional regulator [Streptomyces sp. NPDC059104]|uniref:TetR/AcrR family transcriptional regulator n=1 Tax=unclassified Streptomyces TaxID=2593676 RepID=UPI0033A1BE26
MTTRRRLSPDDRRAQLRAVGAALFAAKPYEDVLMEEVAERAGVSRALLYRYFPGKRELFAAVYREASDRLLSSTALDPDVPASAWLRAGLDTHIDYFAANRNTVLAANRTLAGDPVVQAIIDDELAGLRAHLLTVTAPAEEQYAMVSAVVTSWLVFVRALCVDWLLDGAYSRTALADICVGALTGALATVPGLRPLPAAAGR